MRDSPRVQILAAIHAAQVTQANIEVQEQRHARPGDYPEMYAMPDKLFRETGWTAKRDPRSQFYESKE
eukprot:scaffold29410_cov20-Prasinocladus_malaysianus.AAC.1